jgi:hypothetical protein
MPAVTLVRQRDILLNRKLSQRIAADLEIQVADREVEGAVRLAVETRQGEAKFYEYLAQQGITLERWKIEKAQEILERKLQYLFQTGISPDQRGLLPARITPTPREVLIAFEHDPARRAVGGRVRRLEFKVDVDQETRNKLVMQQLTGGKDKEWVSAQIEQEVESKLNAVVAELKTVPFEEVAKSRGAPVAKQHDEWIPVAGDGPAEQFLKSAKEGSWKRFALPEGGYLFVFLVKRENPGDRSTADAEVAEEYGSRIQTLRASKWEAVMRIRALDKATVRPERVRQELRRYWLAILRDADQGLRALGLN